MHKATILVGFAEAMAAPETVWSLVDAGFRVVAFRRKGRAAALQYSRHVVCHEVRAPEEDVQSSIADIRALMNSVADEDASVPLVFFPLDDKAVWISGMVREYRRWLLAGPQGPCADLALNKDVQMEAAREAGFSVPHTALVQTADELSSFCASNGFPIILKASECVPRHNGRLGPSPKWVCANQAELARAIGQWEERVPLLAQTFITGTGEGVFGLASKDGIRAWSAHRRLRMMNPQGSGASACTSLPVSDETKSHVLALLTKAGWRGLFMIELLRDESGTHWFVELNGRPWGSTALCRRQGLEYPAWHVELTLDEQSSAGRNWMPGPGVVCRNAGREFMHLLFVLRGAKSNALRKWPPFWRTLGDVFRIRRSDKLYNWRRDDIKVFLADFYLTIHDNLFKAHN